MKKIELTILLALLFSIFTLSPQAETAGIAEKVTRLHILANSDSDADQALKLYVRDQLLNQVDLLAGDYTKDTLDEATLRHVEAVAQQAVTHKGYDYSVRAEAVNMYFDTRIYDGFALPAGRYDALRVRIGQGKGKNWWCVMFPPLCTPLAQGNVTDIARDAGLTNKEIGLITQDGTVYAFKFKIAEWLGALTH